MKLLDFFIDSHVCYVSENIPINYKPNSLMGFIDFL